MSETISQAILTICEALVMERTKVEDLSKLIGAEFKGNTYRELRIKPKHTAFSEATLWRTDLESNVPFTVTLILEKNPKFSIGMMRSTFGDYTATPRQLGKPPELAFGFDNGDVFTCTLFAAYASEDGEDLDDAAITEIMLRRDIRL